MSHEERCRRAARSLRGLAVGDALGERFFGPQAAALGRIEARQLPPAPWRYTDDTEMALSVFAALRDGGYIEQDSLARAFASRMHRERGYGRAAFEILFAIGQGGDWRTLSGGVFGGTGSYGNGAAMRVAPLGVYFADDLERCASEARLQAQITHTHPEGIAGAIAVSVAAAIVWRGQHAPPSAPSFLESVLEHVPMSSVSDGLRAAIALSTDTTVDEAARALGNGSSISAQDTVPFCSWIASRHLQGTFEDAFWETVSALGDRDTTCAIVGGILGAVHQPPSSWLSSCEKLEP